MNNQPNWSFVSSSFNLLYPEECFARPGTGRKITPISNDLSEYVPPVYIVLPGQDDKILEFNNTLESLVKSCQYCNNEGKKSQEMSNIHPCDDTTTGCSHLPLHQNKSKSKKPKSLRQVSVSRDRTCSKFQHKEHLACCKAVSRKARKTNKTRIKWNEDLHKKFVEIMHRLGGPRKATPKGILKLMNCEELTIFHVKSHLQKYRSCQHMPDETVDPCFCINTEQLDNKIGLQLLEVLKMQLDVQRRLHEQIETQKKLQAQIEEQARQLHTMIQSLSKTNNTCFLLYDQ